MDINLLCLLLWGAATSPIAHGDTEAYGTMCVPISQGMQRVPQPPPGSGEVPVGSLLEPHVLVTSYCKCLPCSSAPR